MQLVLRPNLPNPETLNLETPQDLAPSEAAALHQALTAMGDWFYDGKLLKQLEEASSSSSSSSRGASK